ncbi:unnamed protein product [Closterium sp. NIES-53]
MHSRLLVSGLPRSLPPLLPSLAPPCLPCVKERQRDAPHSSSFPLTTAPLQTLCMDVWGPARVSGQGRERYFLLVVDDYTRYTTVFPLRSKGQVVDVLIPWIRAVRLQLHERFRADLPVLLQHCDRGGEFSSNLLQDFCRGEGILQSFTLPDSPQQNGIAERRIGLVMEVAHPPPCAVPGDSGAARGTASGGAEPGGAETGVAELGTGGVEPKGVEPGGVESGGAEYGGARVTAGAGVSGGIAATGPGGACTRGTGAAGTGGVGGAGAGDPTKPGAAGAGGSSASGAGAGGAGVEDTGAGGAGAGGASDRVPLPAPLESSLPAFPDPESDRVCAASPTVSRLLATAVTDPSFESTAAPALLAELLDFAAACRLDYATALVVESASAYPPSFGGECALGTDVLEDRQEDFECLATAVPRFASMLLAPKGDPDAPDIPTPRSYAEAITGPYSSQRLAAMDAEMASWKVKRPPGSPPAFKVRYVARGFSQRQGVDYFQTFSPTPKMTTLRVLLHVAAQRDYELHSLDLSRAFLKGCLHEEIWLRRPQGFTGSFPAGTQWSLRRPVYSLCQAPCEWHDTLRTTLAAFGFAPSTADPSLFLRTDTSLPPFYVLVYVDDVVFATADTEALTLVKSELQKRRTCTDLGELCNSLGLQITQDRARCTITLTRSHMVHQVLQRFSFQFSSPQPTPLSTSHSLSAPPSDKSVSPSGPYPELVGCLMYLMTCTRPDLAYPLSLLARYVAPGRHQKVHWDAAKRVLRYLCSTSGMGLVLGGLGPVVLTGHADTSCVDDSSTQRSSHGYTFSLGSGSVSWRSTRSSLVLGSSCEAEICAGAMAVQELCWLTYLLTDLREQPRSPPVLYVDNKAMIALYQEHRLDLLCFS